MKLIAATVLAIAVGAAASGCGAASRERPQPPIAVARCCFSIFLLHRDGSTQFIAMGDNQHWSPDHRRLVFRRAGHRSDAWLIQADGTGLTRLTTVDPPNQVRFLAFGGRPAIIAYDDSYGIWIMRPDGSGRRNVLRDSGNDNELAIARDGSTIAYARNDTRSSPAELDLVAINGGGRRVVFRGREHTCGVASPTWSPDGHWIAFSLCTDKGNNEEGGIWLVRADGRDLHRIALGGGSPTWSPDGKWIAFGVSKENAQQDDELGALVKIHPDGSGRVQLTPYVSGDAVDEDPDW